MAERAVVTLEETLDAAFREAFKMIFAKGTPLIGKTFNEKKLRQSKGTDAEAQMLWAKDMLLTGVEGTGLGLYIVYSEIERLGGEISLESAVGRGSVFHLRIPDGESPGQNTCGDRKEGAAV